jgi:hypothetical protein
VTVKRTVNQGSDRLTRIADRVLQLAEADADVGLGDGDRVVVVITNVRGGTGFGLLGYRQPGAEAVAADDLGRVQRALADIVRGRPRLVTPKHELPGGLQRDGGPGWLSRREGKP